VRIEHELRGWPSLDFSTAESLYSINMAKLADITSELRIVLKILGGAAITVLVIFLGIKGGQIAKEIFFPTPAPPPEERFGALPEVVFPTQATTEVKYKINTLNGQLPSTGNLPGNLPDRMKVYKVKAQTASLVALAAVRETLKNARFDKNEAKISETVYRWTNQDGTSIQYNIVNNNFRITSNFLNDAPPSRLSGAASTRDGAYERAIGFLEEIRQDTEDLDQAKTKQTYLRIQNGSLIAASSQSEAQFIKIELYQKNLDEKAIYYEGISTSPMYFIFRNEDDNPRIVEASFYHFPADTDPSEYGIKTADQAFKDLESGKAYVRLEDGKSEVDITDVNLAYYLSENPQYFLPVFIFSGSEVTAIVNAISSQ